MGAAAFASQSVSSAGGGYVQAQAIRAQGDYKKRVAEMNASNLDLQAQGAEAQAIDAEKRGSQKVAQREQDIRKSTGSQRAALAAAGADVNSEMASNIVNETQVIGEADKQAIQVNAWREAFGFRSEALAIKGKAANTRTEGALAASAAKYEARSTMISGLIGAGQSGAQSYGKMKEAKVK